MNITTRIQHLIVGGIVAGGLALGGVAAVPASAGPWGGADGFVGCQGPGIDQPVDNCDHPDETPPEEPPEEVIPEVTPADPPLVVQPTFTG